MVRLDGHEWSDATHLALLTLKSLKVLTLTVVTISSPSARVLGNGQCCCYRCLDTDCRHDLLSMCTHLICNTDDFVNVIVVRF